ncbi:MAG: GGDEF domain-containing protein, partial [Myxococcales bacterium]|nr:GGDEF domain-containing protein [Myxococcales bacterium]
HVAAGVAVALALGILIIDATVDGGVAIGVLYILPVLIAATVGRLGVAIGAAAACTALLVVGWILSPAHVDPRESAMNHAFGALAIWVVALVAASRMGLLAHLRATQGKLMGSAVRDTLTGLYNRGHFEECLRLAVNDARRYGGELSVCMCDLDRLKEVNDRYGHSAGDEMLRRIAATISANLRDADFAGRYGGDELCIAFPHTDIAQAGHCVMRIREALSHLRVPLAGGEEVGVSATFGVVGIDGHRADGTLLLKEADDALYKAKSAGRGGVVVRKVEPEDTEG